MDIITIFNIQFLIRSKLKPESADTKFLDAMQLIDQTREAWQISGANVF